MALKSTSVAFLPGTSTVLTFAQLQASYTNTDFPAAFVVTTDQICKWDTVSGRWVVTTGGDIPGSQLGLNSGFAATVAPAPLVNDFLFGTSAVGGGGVTAVKNLTDLAVSFTAFDYNTQQVTIQEQIEVYQPFNTSNHAFLTDRLNLVALNPNNDWNAQVTQGNTSINLNGTPTPIANLGLATTAGIRVGQLVSAQFHGIYYVSALVTDTSITLTTLNGSPTGASTGALFSFLPIDSAVLSVDFAIGDPVMTFAAVPAGVTGKQVAVVGVPSGTIFVNRNQDYRVQSATATTITVNPAWNFSVAITAGVRILFLSTVTSGQIYTLPVYDISNPNVFFAMELTGDLLAGASAAYSLLNVNTQTLFNAVPSDTPWGAWPAFWAYQAPRGNTALTTDASELDVFEMFNSTTAPTSYIAGNNHGNGAIANRFAKRDSGWAFSAGFNHAPFTFTGAHKWQFVFCNSKTYRFIDDVLIKVDDFEWGSQAPLQIIVNLSVGSILQAYASNVMFPMASTNFPAYVFGLKELKVWYQAP